MGIPHVHRGRAGRQADAGFAKITKCDLQESQDAALRNLANETRMPPGFLRLETLTLEGSKQDTCHRTMTRSNGFPPRRRKGSTSTRVSTEQFLVSEHALKIWRYAR